MPSRTYPEKTNSLQPTSAKYPMLESLARGIRSANEFMGAPFGYENPPVQAITNALGVPAIANTLENLAYGSPVTSGSGWTLRLRPETQEAALAVLPELKPAASALAMGARAGASKLAPTAAGMMENALRSSGMIMDIAPTVMRPQRVAYPDIYKNPKELVAEAASRVAPENPLLKQLFGVDRGDLWEISGQGARKGNMVERPFKAAANPKGAGHASEVMNPRNTRRMQDIISEAQQHPELYQGMASWYVMDPLFEAFKRIHGDNAVREYNRFNAFTGMSSPGSEVLTELNRGTAANWLANQGRFGDFVKYGGLAEGRRGKDFPADMQGIIGHPYHSTAQATPMQKFLDSGELEMGSAKVPSYIHASGVPATGFQTEWPVGDAHWSRLVGLPDVRGAKTIKGVEVAPGASASVPEMVALSPWWRDKVAAPMGLQAVPAQAVVWGAGSGATGVTSPIGAGKLELLAQQIGRAAQRMGVSPETARDMIIRGEAHAGFVTPELAAALASGALGSAALSKLLKSSDGERSTSSGQQ